MTRLRAVLSKPGVRAAGEAVVEEWLSNAPLV
jgi:hypothetical protein